MDGDRRVAVPRSWAVPMQCQGMLCWGWVGFFLSFPFLFFFQETGLERRDHGSWPWWGELSSTAVQRPAVGLRLPGALPQFPWVVQQGELGPEILGQFMCQLLLPVLVTHTQASTAPAGGFKAPL